MSYELHPLCTLFPRVTGAEFTSLVADIKANGLRQPIVLHAGMILDGGNRYRACQEAEVAPIFVEHDGGNLVSFVLSSNLHRRHLSAGQQAAIVASAQDWAVAQKVGKPKSVNVDPLATVDQRAAQSGASRSTQKMADKVAKADPALARQVAHGELSLPKAAARVDARSAKPAPVEALRLVAPTGDVISGDDLGSTDPLEMLEELQRDNESLQKQITLLTVDNTKAELHKMILQRDHAVRQQSAEMDKSRKSQEREKWTKRQLMRCGKAIGEEDPDKIAAAVEAFVRSHKQAA